jgi:hypothetical protein
MSATVPATGSPKTQTARPGWATAIGPCRYSICGYASVHNCADSYRTTHLGVVPAGICVHGHDHGISIVGNHVHDLGNDNPTLGSFDINAHGIAVYGDDPHAAVSGLTIRANTGDHLRLGASETVVVNGNVSHWAIVGNRIHDVDNIGIDAIGFEPTLTGRYRYTNDNRARHGLTADNDVARVRSQGNPAYWEDGEWCNCADGIYVDGGTHIVIADNHVTGSDIGVEVAAENPRGSADHVLVRRNLITGSLFTGLTTGGYCNGAEDCGGVQTGRSHDNVFEDNRLRGNNQLKTVHRNCSCSTTATATCSAPTTSPRPTVTTWSTGPSPTATRAGSRRTAATTTPSPPSAPDRPGLASAGTDARGPARTRTWWPPVRTSTAGSWPLLTRKRLRAGRSTIDR